MYFITRFVLLHFVELRRRLTLVKTSAKSCNHQSKEGLGSQGRSTSGKLLFSLQK